MDDKRWKAKTSQSDKINLNAAALELVEKLIADPGKYRVSVEQESCGATLIDSSTQARGGFLAGEIVSRICMGGCASVQILPMQYEGTVLPSAFVHTDYPVQSTLASQYSDWKITIGSFSAFASGPARALAHESPELFKKIGYKEKLDKAVLALETETRPTEEIIDYIAKKCNIEPSNLYLLMYSTKNLVGATQISSGAISAGMFKLLSLGFDPWLVQHAWGYAPILPLHQSYEAKTVEATDAITYGGTACYQVDFEDDQKLANITMRMPASAAKMFREANKLAEKNPELINILNLSVNNSSENKVSPAVVKMHNLKTGKNFRAGNLDIPVLKELFKIV